MTPAQLLKHYHDDEREVAFKLGYHLYTIRGWVKEGIIPPRAQKFIEYATAGKLKADKRKPKRGDKNVKTEG